jgi:hypothetical protein
MLLVSQIAHLVLNLSLTLLVESHYFSPARSMLKKLRRASLILLLVTLSACSSSTPATTENSVEDKTAPEAMAPSEQPKVLDATDKNPGTSVNPPDAGKTKQSDEFSYTLLDVRQDTVDAAYGGYPVFLVKLRVTRIAGDEKVGLSVAQADLASTKSNAERGVDNELFFRGDIAYSRAKVGVDLAGDVKSLKMNESVVGYYIYRADIPSNPAAIYFNIRNIGLINPELGILSWADSFRVK